MIGQQTEIRAFLRRLRTLALLIVLLIAGGTAGLALTEDDSVWDAFQWALDTIATIGSHPRPETVSGQIVKVLLTVLGVGTLLYVLVSVTEVFVAGHLTELLAERRRTRLAGDGELAAGAGTRGVEQRPRAGRLGTEGDDRFHELGRRSSVGSGAVEDDEVAHDDLLRGSCCEDSDQDGTTTLR